MTRRIIHKHRARIFLAGAVAGVAGFTLPATGAEVTYERLLNAQNDPNNWLLPYGSYNNHNHSNLNQINRSNVGDLRVRFLHAIGGADFQIDTRFQATPAVNDGFMYISNPWGQVFKIDVRSGNRGEPIWMADAEVEEGTRMRGSVALLGNYVYALASEKDLRLLKIDADSGEIVWEASTLGPEEEVGRLDQRQSVQPLAVKNQLLVATTGTARRNYVGAIDAETGDVMWRFWTIPGPGEFGHDTWGGDWEAWRTGGAAVWTQGAFDPETNLAIYGTGEPSPWYDPEFRPGDNLFSASTIAIDVDTGELGWYFQETPNETWDYDTVNPKMLYDIEVGGQTRTAMGNFSRNGFYYTLDRSTGEFLMASAYTAVNWTAGLDPKTGLPVEYDPDAEIQDYAPGMSMRAGRPETSQNVCPYFYGMPTLMPPTYDAERQVAYIGAQEGCFSQALETPFPRESYVGRSFSGATRFINGQTAGVIWAIDVTTSELLAKTYTEHTMYNGTLGTSGDLLFTAQLDGKFAAYDKDTLSELWSFHAGTPISAPPISYMVDGRQYIAVLAGGQDQSEMAGRPELALYQRAPTIIVFGL